MTGPAYGAVFAGLALGAALCFGGFLLIRARARSRIAAAGEDWVPAQPLLSMLVLPRRTSRWVIRHRSGLYVPALAILIGVAQAQPADGWGRLVEGWGESAAAIVKAGLLGLVGMWACSAVLTLVGRLLGGRGDFRDLCTAYTWGGIASIASAPPMLLLDSAGKRWFEGRGDESALSMLYGGFVTAVFLAVILWILWSGIVAIAEAHRFSAGRSIAALAISLSPLVLLLAYAYA